MTSSTDNSDREGIAVPESASFRLSNTAVRYLTALLVLPVVLAVSYLGGVLWAVSMGIVAIIGGLEYYFMAHGRESQGSILIGVPMVLCVLAGFYFKQPLIWIIGLIMGSVATFILEYLRHPDDLKRTLLQILTTLSGVLYLGFPLAFAIAIRNIEDDGLAWVLVIFASTWGTDSFAYLGGHIFGRTPLAPKLSPKKTREGAVAGVVGGFVPALLLVLLFLELTPGVLVLLMVVPFVAIVGDLFESAIKRYFHVKDSHVAGLNILPGHGGILDRIDALLWVLVVFYAYLVLVGAFG